MHDNARGAAAMMAAMALFSLNDALMKLVFVTVPVGQGMLFRGVLSAAIGFAVIYALRQHAHLKSMGDRPVLLRAVCDGMAAIFFLYGLSLASLATLTAMIQATPLIATGLAAAVMGEPVGWRRWTATGVGLLGVLIIIAPDGLWLGGAGTDDAGFEAAALLGLGAAFFAAARDIVTRAVPAETPTLILALAAVVGNVLVGVGLSVGGDWGPLSAVTAGDAIRLLGAATLVIGAHYMVGRAMRIGEISAVSPFRYVIVLWAMLWSYALFADPPGVQALFGTLLVIGAGLYTLRRERVRGSAIAPAASSGLRGADAGGLADVTRTRPAG